LTAAAVRFVAGTDLGLEYDSTALSSTQRGEFGEPLPRTPWALRVRPDLMGAWFDARHYVYLQADGSFAQPFAVPAADGDNPEFDANTLLGARLRLGRRATLIPTAFWRMLSSNSLVSSLDQLAGGGGTRPSGQFQVMATGGGLALTSPLGSAVRLSLDGNVEYWNLEHEQENTFYVPPEMRAEQPRLVLNGAAALWFHLTGRDGLAAEALAYSGLFFADDLEGTPAELAGGRTMEYQLNLTGRVVYQRQWLPFFITTVTFGVGAARGRQSEVETLDPSSLAVGHGWELNLVGGASLIFARRPRWLTLIASYDRSYQQVAFRNASALHDAITLMALWGPFFRGITVTTALNWARLPLDVARSRDCASAGCDAEGGNCTHPPGVVRQINTVGLQVDVRYMRDVGNWMFGPFLESNVYAQLPEAPDAQGVETSTGIDDDDCYVPAHFDRWEGVVMVGLRAQWGVSTGRAARRGGHAGAAIRGSRRARRLAVQRMTHEERRVPGYAYGAAVARDDAAEEELFDRHDPLGRWGGDDEADALMDGEAFPAPPSDATEVGEGDAQAEPTPPEEAPLPPAMEVGHDEPEDNEPEDNEPEDNEPEDEQR
jgi:hypothetical protein